MKSFNGEDEKYIALEQKTFNILLKNEWRNMLEESNENYVETEKLCVTLCDKKKYITHHKLMVIKI